MCKQEREIGLENWLPHGTRPVCHYTAPGRVTYWSKIAESCIGTETYTGLRWLYGLGYTTCVLLFLGSSSSLCLAETYTGPYKLHGSNYTTHVHLFLYWHSGFHLEKGYMGLWLCLHNPCTSYQQQLLVF